MSRFDVNELSRYVEAGVEVPKETLVHRVAGKIDYSLFTYIKSMVFHHVFKDQKERVFFV